ncbi:MAG: hypothetical protein E7570_02405 [Ruminococcaceae bacterium]|nr:hypothetical protein [Oscillospiraceae bacterium]
MDDSKLKELICKSKGVAPVPQSNLDFEMYVWKKMIEGFVPKVQELFDNYLESGEYPDFEYEGWSLTKIAEHTNYEVLDVFNELNKIMTDENYCKYFGFMNFGKK